MQSDDDLLTFADERESPLTAVAVHTRKILIVDDDEDVHQATTFALQGLEILGHPLIFLHAYSAHEAESRSSSSMWSWKARMQGYASSSISASICS